MNKYPECDKVKEISDISQKIGRIYCLLASDGYGNNIFSENQTMWLNEAKNILLMKYPETDFRIRFINICIVHDRENRFSMRDKEYLRYIFHDECEPEVSHKTLLDTLKDTIENKGVLYRYPDYGDE